MASVYRATDEILDRTIALKVLMPGADALTRKRFRQEARTVSILDHPNIVRTLQVGQTSANGVAYIAMDLVQGTSLSDLLDECNILSVVTACALLEPIARALAYAHSLGVIHRDVKPSNILLNQAEPDTEGAVPLGALATHDFFVPFLSDFGIARALDSPELTSAGRTIGTPAYMAPEQCAGSREIDGRADIYSLGTVLYRCLVGRPPFIGTTTQILHAHVYESLMIPDDVLAELPSAVVEALRRSLMKEPEYRYKDASEMADALATVSGDSSSPVAALNGRAFQDNIKNAGELAPTRTITVMPSADGTEAEEAGSTSHVLIQGALPGGQTQSPKVGTSTQMPLIKKSSSGSTTHQRVSGPAAPPAHGRPNWSSIILGGVLLLLLAFIGTALMSALWPGRESIQPTMNTPFEVVGVVQSPSDSVAGSPTAVLASSVNETETIEPTPQELTSASIAQPATASPTPTGAPPTATSLPTPTDSPTPSLVEELGLRLDDATYFFERREWLSALDELKLIVRTDSSFESAVVQKMLAESYEQLGNDQMLSALSNNSVDTDALQTALNFYQLAADIGQNSLTLETVIEAISEWIDGASSEDSTAQVELAETFEQHASAQANRGANCSAMEQITIALRFSYSSDAATEQKRLAVLCPQLRSLIIEDISIDDLDGTIYYSSVDDAGRNHVWRVQVAKDGQSESVLVDGRLPAVSPDGTILAYRSESPEGIRGFDLIGNQRFPYGQFIQFTYNPEDSLDSPPSWSASGDRIVFSSIVSGDRVPRIYWAGNSGTGDYWLYGDGREPDWHPTDGLIVYKGADETGNRPGIWLMDNLGRNKQRITNNSGDTRPIWSADGKSILFMSDGRDDNWDIYSVNVGSKNVKRLTKHGASDGLPTVNPSGDEIAFLSNREGEWMIYIVSMEGSEPRALTRISGNLPNWLEHGIQWMK